MEEMLISAVMPIMSVYRLPLGQYGYSGHVVNLPQDVASFSHWPSLTTPRRCLEDAPVSSSEISASFLLSWTCPSTPLTLALSSLTRGEQPTRPSSRQWYWTRSCGRLVRTLSR